MSGDERTARGSGGNAPRPGMRRAARLLAIAAAAVAGLVVLAAVTVGVLATTTFGARTAYALLGERVPGELSIGAIEGSLARGLVLRDVRFTNETLDVALRLVVVVPAAREILDGNIVLERIAVADGYVAIARDEDPPPAERPLASPSLPELPETLALHAVEIDAVTLRGFGDDVVVEQARASSAGSALEVETLAVAVAGNRLTASASAVIEGGDARGTLRAAVVPADSDDRLDVETNFVLAATAEPWYVGLDWQRIAFGPAASSGGDEAQPAVSSTGGTLVARVGMEPIAVELTAPLAGTLLPDAADVAANVGVGAETIAVESLRVTTLGATAEASGAYDLAAQTATAVLQIEDVDPARLGERVNGNLDGRFDLTYANAAPRRATVVGALGGELDGRALAADLDVALVGDALTIDSARVTLGDGRVEAAGTLTQAAADLTFSATLPELTAWYPPASGTLSASGSLSGPFAEAAVDVSVTGERLALADSTLPPIERVTLDVDGTLAEHVLELSAASELGTVDLRSTQRFADSTLRGTLERLRIANPQAGTWTLRAPAAFVAAAELAAVALERACWTGPESADLCVALADRRVEIASTRLPSALADPWLPSDLDVTGAAELAAAADFSGPLTASLTLRQPSLELLRVVPPEDAPLDAAPAEDAPDETPGAPRAARVTNADADADADDADADDAADAADGGAAAAGETLLRFAALEGLALNVDLTEDALTAELSAALAATGDAIEGRVTVTPPTADGLLEARLSAALTDLGIVDALVEGVDALRGAIAVELAATGSPRTPAVTGEIAVTSLAAELPPLGIAIADGELNARAAGTDALAFDAQLCSGGCIALDGALDLSGDGWALAAALAGSDFLLVDLPDFRAVVASDLRLTADAELALMTGSVAVDEGLVALDDVPRSAVRPVEATVVHGRPEPAESERGLALPFALDITTTLGGARFEGLGIGADLAGTLEVEQPAAGPLLVSGTTNIEGGTFEIYGQTLTIERGQLIFTGPPDNPSLNLRATREVDDATVGLLITGTARHPRSEVFSEPALAESEAFARLVTGRSLSAGGDTDPEALERAAIGLGLKRALPTLDRLGASLGLDELGVADPGDTEGALVAGKQLGEDIYLRYKHGLFDDFAGLELIYRITERFRLRTETGTSQSLDLIYEVDRDRRRGSRDAGLSGAFEEYDAAEQALNDN